MKGTLTYNLPEEEEEFRTAQDGQRWKSVVYEIDEMFRQAIKHGGHSEDVTAKMETFRRDINSLVIIKGLELHT